MDDIIHELKQALDKYHHLDVVTLTANGEPTLYPNLDELIHKIHEIKNHPKLLILSNGSTIMQPSIQESLSHLDIVKLSLDCVSEKCFKRLDRAHKDIRIDSIIEGMKTFRKRYHGELIVEILVVEGLNDTFEEFKLLNEVLQAIKPDRIDVGTIDRPPAYDVKGVSIDTLVELSHYLENLPVAIAYKKNYIPEKRSFNEAEILELLKRRPQSFEDIELCFDAQSLQNLQKLLKQKVLHVKKIAGVDFYKTNQ